MATLQGTIIKVLEESKLYPELTAQFKTGRKKIPDHDYQNAVLFLLKLIFVNPALLSSPTPHLKQALLNTFAQVQSLTLDQQTALTNEHPDIRALWTLLATSVAATHQLSPTKPTGRSPQR